jgi:hypothetical protein
MQMSHKRPFDFTRPDGAMMPLHTRTFHGVYPYRGPNFDQVKSKIFRPILTGFGSRAGRIGRIEDLPAPHNGSESLGSLSDTT